MNAEEESGYVSSPEEKILLSHGAGGKLTHELIENVFFRAFNNPTLSRAEDAAVLDHRGSRLAFTVDSHVVSPLFFPGGDIGKLAVCGTVNDLSMAGATPLFLGISFILEEGLPTGVLLRITESAARAAQEAGVQIVCGDTKVVEKGSADQTYVTTCGIGGIASGVEISPANAQPGDKIILSGTIGDHEIAILSARESLPFSGNIASDCAPLNGLVAAMLGKTRAVHALRDPTRGGLATTLNEIARLSNVAMEISESAIPINPQVEEACEILGLDPLYLANEGKLVAFVAAEAAQDALAALQSHPYGSQAAIIGEVSGAGRPRVTLLTSVGGRRALDMPVGTQLPRIC